MNPRILLQGGVIVTPAGISEKDILLEGPQIVAVQDRLAGDAPSAEIVRVDGLTILPGLIDVHVHLREPGNEHKEDFYTGTCAALAGGVTTVFAMPNTSPPIIDEQTFDQASQLAEQKAVCDYGLYVGATPTNAEQAASLSNKAVALKMYIGSSTGSLLVDQFPAQIRHFETYPPDRIIAVHAEDEAAVQYYAARGIRRPPVCAALATSHAIALAEQAQRRLHICHASTGYELMQVRDARRRGLDVTCEATPHHLFINSNDEALLGTLSRVNPPIRSQDDVTLLWELRNVIDMIATDHAPHTLDEKNSDTPPSGMPGLETMLPLLLSAADAGLLSLQDLVRWTSSHPAEVFRIARKGQIAPGYDADLTLVDLEDRWVIRGEDTVSKCGWSAFDGRAVQGRVKQVYLRGRKVFDNGEILAAPGFGEPVTVG